MSTARPEIIAWPVGRGWIQATLSATPSPRAALLVVAPFFHEWQRSYRLFAVLADALAGRGIGVLRFDYRGTGESSGDDAEFLPSRALDDIDAALGLLQSRCPAPTTLMGVRAGALLAERAAERRGVAWGAWQGVDDGAGYLGELRQRDVGELNNRQRFPFLGRSRQAEPDVLMGHRTHPEFALELGIFRRRSEPAWRVEAANRCGPDDLPLSPELSDWIAQIDLQGALPLAAVAALAEQMAARLTRTRGVAA